MSFYDGCGTSCSAHLGMKKASIPALLKVCGTAEHFSQIYPVCIEKIFSEKILRTDFRKSFFYKENTIFVPHVPHPLKMA